MLHVKAFLKVPLFYYKVIGLGLWDNLFSRKYVNFQKVFFSVNLCNLILYTSSQIYATYKNPHNLINGSPVPSAFLYNAIFYGKLITVLTRRISLYKLLVEMNAIFPKSTRGKSIFRFEFYQKQLRVMVRILLVMCFAATYLFSLAPFAQSFSDYYRFGKFTYHLPSLSWFDNFEDKQLLSYYLIYVHQLYAVHICSMGIIAADLFLCHLIFLLCMFFDHISKEFTTLKEQFRDHLEDTVDFHNKILW